MQSFLIGLACTSCGKIHDDMKTISLRCTTCGGFLQARYDLARAANGLRRDDLSGTGRGIWGVFALLPVRGKNQIVSLMEGDTPLLPLRSWGKYHGLKAVFGKDETRNPTGSFKDRGASVTISKCREVGIQTLVISSSGNASAAFSAYSAAGKRNLYVLIRPNISLVLSAQTAIYGARAIRVGDNREGGQLASELCREKNWFDCATPRNLYRIEGKKTIAYEMAQQMNWAAPKFVVCPTGGGTNVLAIWKGFNKMKELGWISKLPRIVVIQPEGCAPIVRAFWGNVPVRPWDTPASFALGITVPAPPGGDAVVDVLKASGGIAETVSDEEIADAERTLARQEGLFVQPASAASLAGVAKLAKAGAIAADDVIVCVLTGTGKNSPNVAIDIAGEIPIIEPTMIAFQGLLTIRHWH